MAQIKHSVPVATKQAVVNIQTNTCTYMYMFQHSSVGTDSGYEFTQRVYTQEQSHAPHTHSHSHAQRQYPLSKREAGQETECSYSTTSTECLTQVSVHTCTETACSCGCDFMTSVTASSQHWLSQTQAPVSFPDCPLLATMATSLCCRLPHHLRGSGGQNGSSVT